MNSMKKFTTMYFSPFNQPQSIKTQNAHRGKTHACRSTGGPPGGEQVSRGREEPQRRTPENRPGGSGQVREEMKRVKHDAGGEPGVLGRFLLLQLSGALQERRGGSSQTFKKGSWRRSFSRRSLRSPQEPGEPPMAPKLCCFVHLLEQELVNLLQMLKELRHLNQKNRFIFEYLNDLKNVSAWNSSSFFSSSRPRLYFL